MRYHGFQKESLSALGFGAMRLPCKEDGAIDEAQVRDMVAYAIKNGVNYFDTAWMYHGGNSETVMGRVLKDYPRESWKLATKYPVWPIRDHYDPAEIFEQQLKKCGVDYFDFYLLHNVDNKSIDIFLNPDFGIIDYFLEQKRLGRIRHLGFSCHADTPGLKRFLDARGSDMEFCQIQLNYLDWTLQDAKGKYELLTQRGIPVWVMEPVRGGRLAKLNAWEEDKLKALRENASTASWAFRFLHTLPNVTMVLSGMSNMAQVKDNVQTFSGGEPLSEAEVDVLLQIAENLKRTIPCTACRYCCDGCPAGLDIPMLLHSYNELRFAPGSDAKVRLLALEPGRGADACLACGKCKDVCPQHIDIPRAMQEITDYLK